MTAEEAIKNTIDRIAELKAQQAKGPYATWYERYLTEMIVTNQTVLHHLKQYGSLSYLRLSPYNDKSRRKDRQAWEVHNARFKNISR